jgi:hypothetical protein
VLLVCSPEPATSTPPEAKVALVKFLLALTDERVAFNRAPFDQPEIFPPIDGRAPTNSFGRTGLVARSNVIREPSAPFAPVVTCLDGDDTQGVPDAFTGTCFLQVPETGASGRMVGPDGILGTADDVATRAKGFLGTLSVPTNSELDHFDRVSEPGVAFP